MSADTDITSNMPPLASRAKMDRIRYSIQGTGQRQPNATNVINAVKPFLEHEHPHNIPRVIGDILVGIVRSEQHSSKTLSPARLYTILSCLPVLNTREIQRMTGLSDRQARKYLAAAKAAIPFIQRYYAAHPIEDFDHEYIDASPRGGPA